MHLKNYVLFAFWNGFSHITYIAPQIFIKDVIRISNISCSIHQDSESQLKLWWIVHSLILSSLLTHYYEFLKLHMSMYVSTPMFNVEYLLNDWRYKSIRYNSSAFLKIQLGLCNFSLFLYTFVFTKRYKNAILLFATLVFNPLRFQIFD